MQSARSTASLVLPGLRRQRCCRLEFRPDDQPRSDAEFRVAPEQITTELIDLCDQFLRQASATVHNELRQFLAEHAHHGDLGWLLDALGLTVVLDRTALSNVAGPPQ